MHWTRRALLGSTTTALTVAGCLGSGDGSESEETDSTSNSDGESTESTAEEPNGDAPASAVQVHSHPEHGDILAGPEELTLYMFDQDTQGEAASTCYDGCAESWPPLTVEEGPAAGEDVTASLTTFERDDGSMQVAADGWPLYYFAQDEAPGDAEGQGADDIWWVLRPDGTPVRPDEHEQNDEHGHDTEAVDAPVEHAEIAMVSADGHHFEPHLVWIESGGTVTWTLESGSHTTTAYHSDADRPDRIPDGAEGWDSGFLGDDGETFERTFDVEGVYDYFCRPHEGRGMVGSVVVGDPDPHEQPALEPPQADLPEEARTVLEELNAAANETLGHTHD